MDAETPCAAADCPRDATGCNRCLAAENEALLSELREARAQATEAHRLAIESKRKMDAAYDHADLIQHEMTTATDDCPHTSDTWTTCSACHLKVMRERDALTKQVDDEVGNAKYWAVKSRIAENDRAAANTQVEHLTQRVADLQARAIPKAWRHGYVGHDGEFANGTGDAVEVRWGDLGATLSRWPDGSESSVVFTTLSDALAAAAKDA